MTVRHDADAIALLINEEKPYRASILAAILSRIGDDMTDAEAAIVAAVEASPVILRRMTIPDIVNMSGTGETEFASISLPVGVVADNDEVYVNLEGLLNSFDGSAEFTIRVYIGNNDGEDPAVTFTHTPATSQGLAMRVVLRPTAGTPFGGAGPDSGLGYGHMLLAGGDSIFVPYGGIGVMTFDDPVTIRITAQVDLDDTSKLEAFGWSITRTRAVVHADALE